MSVWARDEQCRLVRVIPQRHPKESTVRCLFQENPNSQMEHLGNQQTLFNLNDQGLPSNPQRPYEPPRQGDGVAPPATPTAGGGNINFQQNQYRAPLALYLMWKGPFERFCNLKEPQQTHVFAYLKRLTNSL